MVKSFEKRSKMLKEALSINAARAKTLTLDLFGNKKNQTNSIN